ncbi:uncharacterized protein ASCRUDRAFT_9454 [Ascoidea rubescens DSM 1968]|uniref:Velvet domain-containing protein n=1 Tax=Ascoidea rubescens DSM 1968 TaxID=1344418 RepID=A0A1D2VCN4_9ASCO|nr:hypothetical protein ASCRUDRAFT_9454 [Ascoidea rubescens DSM 1968]ODV59395.1 hypothetical protein ASCRUDRAFT_9454 [Ascoidea rubescens DSM 1968]
MCLRTLSSYDLEFKLSYCPTFAKVSTKLKPNIELKLKDNSDAKSSRDFIVVVALESASSDDNSPKSLSNALEGVTVEPGKYVTGQNTYNFTFKNLLINETGVYKLIFELNEFCPFCFSDGEKFRNLSRIKSNPIDINIASASAPRSKFKFKSKSPKSTRKSAPKYTSESTSASIFSDSALNCASEYTLSVTPKIDSNTNNNIDIPSNRFSTFNNSYDDDFYLNNYQFDSSFLENFNYLININSLSNESNDGLVVLNENNRFFSWFI